MFRNYLLISLRNISKQFSYSFINISGLALGLATCLLLVTWIRHELSYDRFHEKAPRIYRASLEYSFGGHVSNPPVSPNALLPALMTLPETETGVRVYKVSWRSPYLVKYGDNTFEEDRFYLADSTFFDVFSFDLIRGNKNKCLVEPYSVLLTEATAKKYFGEEDPLGKTLFINNSHDYTVTGVIRAAPSNSLLKFDFVGSFNSIPAGREQPTWWSANYQTFVLLNRNADIGALTDKTNKIVYEAVGRELTGSNDYVRYNFMPLTDIYLHSGLNETQIVSDIKYVYIFSGVTLLILLIACINYVNLATARAAGRAKEVGIRKVSGALRKQLFAQFIGESFVITCISFALAIIVAQLFLPLFNKLTGNEFSYHILFDPSFAFLALGGLLIVALTAGVYPAMVLTYFNPVQVLKGNFRTSSRGAWLRKSLVTFQFGISVILISATIVVIKQLDFIRNMKLGFDRENTIIIPLDSKTEDVFERLKTELKRTGTALYVGRGSESPAHVSAGYALKTAEQEGSGISITGLLADQEYIPSVGIELSAGRNFTREDVERLRRDTVYTFILNEVALDALFIPRDEAIGKKVSVHGRIGEVIGVVKNFHFSPLHDPIDPLVMFPEEVQFEKVFVKLPAGDIQANITNLKKIYSNIITHRPFEFDYLDQQYRSLYQAEERMGSIVTVFSILAIIIACMGLFGLVSFSAEQKRKEIGIRKVLGATASGIVILVTREFSKLVVIAILAGLPVAYWLITNLWLSDFAYKVHIGLWPFFIASLLCMIIALATTVFQAVKASLVDPAETLRNE